MDQEIHPCGQGRIDSVKINPSLLRMRECLIYWPSLLVQEWEETKISTNSDAKNFASLMECDYRWSPTPKPLVVSYLSESESEVGNLSSLSPLACRMATKVISVETSSLSATHQSDKIDGPSLMALFSAWLSCFSLLLKQILVATQKIRLIFNIH